MTGASAGSTPAGFEGYEAVRESAAVEIRPSGGLVALSGRDARSFLHGVLTNDVAGLAPGQACYAAYLTPQGRMVSDLHVLRREHDFLLLVEPHAAAGLVAKFDTSIFTEDVRIEDRSAGTASFAVHGPRARAALGEALSAAAAALVTPLSAGLHVTIAGEAGRLSSWPRRGSGCPAYVSSRGSPTSWRSGSASRTRACRCSLRRRSKRGASRPGRRCSAWT